MVQFWITLQKLVQYNIKIIFGNKFLYFMLSALAFYVITVIVKLLGDDEITSADGLIIALRSHEVGEKVEITLVRGKEEKKVTVELGSDEELQNQQQDDSSTDTGNGGITDEQLRQYLEELLGQQGQGQGYGQGY